MSTPVPLTFTELGNDAGALPVDHTFGCDQDERLLPSSPDLLHADPEQLVRRRQTPARPLSVESQELLTKSKVCKYPEFQVTIRAETFEDQQLGRIRGNSGCPSRSIRCHWLGLG